MIVDATDLVYACLFGHPQACAREILNIRGILEPGHFCTA
jgi:hypothetical protein